MNYNGKNSHAIKFNGKMCGVNQGMTSGQKLTLNLSMTETFKEVVLQFLRLKLLRG